MKNEPKLRPFKGGIAIGLICLILCTPSISLGWGAGGHMMTAQIAFSRMNAKAQAKANELLAIAIDPAEVTAESPDFVSASVWPDAVKKLAGFEFSGDLHFIDFPFSTDGTKLPKKLPKPENIVKALERYVGVLKTSSDQNEQAQALRFVIHFVGDIHQPLHCATKVSKQNPQGDLGGNQLMIKLPKKGGKFRSVKLHSYWDGGIETFPREGPAPKFTPPALTLIPPAAAIAMKHNPDTDPALKLDDPFNYKAWADESNKLAKSVAYNKIANGKQPSAAYKSAAIKVVRQRVAWGGYRLAALLNAIWPE